MVRSLALCTFCQTTLPFRSQKKIMLIESASRMYYKLNCFLNVYEYALL